MPGQIVGGWRISACVPAARKPGHEAMMVGLRNLFDAHAADGAVEILYDCELSIGPLAAG